MHNFSDDSECLEESDSDSLDEHRPHQRIRGVGEEEEEEEIENEEEEGEEEGEEAGEVVSAIELGTRKPLRCGRPEDADTFDDPMEGDDHETTVTIGKKRRSLKTRRVRQRCKLDGHLSENPIAHLGTNQRRFI